MKVSLAHSPRLQLGKNHLVSITEQLGEQKLSSPRNRRAKWFLNSIFEQNSSQKSETANWTIDPNRSDLRPFCAKRVSGVSVRLYWQLNDLLDIHGDEQKIN